MRRVSLHNKTNVDEHPSFRGPFFHCHCFIGTGFSEDITFVGCHFLKQPTFVEHGPRSAIMIDGFSWPDIRFDAKVARLARVMANGILLELA